MTYLTNQPRMYDEFALLWPPISASEGYAEVAQHWRDALLEKLSGRANMKFSNSVSAVVTISPT